MVTGEVGTAAAISEITLGRGRAASTPPWRAPSASRRPSRPRDQKTFTVATTVYDSLGGEHTISFNFEKVAGHERVDLAGRDGGRRGDHSAGGTGRVRFSDNGAISSFTYDDRPGGLSFRPQDADAGGGGRRHPDHRTTATSARLTGLTQFEGTGNLRSHRRRLRRRHAWWTSTSTRAA